MRLDPAAAKALFAIVLTNTQGVDALKPQLPLHVTDRGESWLVTGTPYSDLRRKAHYCMCDMFFSKQTAEVKGIDCHARMILTDKEKNHWAQIMTPEQYERVFEPPARFEPQGVGDIWLAAYGGVVNTAEAAAQYAAILMGAEQAHLSIASSALSAEERDKIWHITRFGGSGGEILAISRTTGRVLSSSLPDGRSGNAP